MQPNPPRHRLSFAGLSFARLCLLALPLLAAPLLLAPGRSEGASPAPIPLPATDAAVPADAGPQTVVLAGGCFWGVQAVFQHTKGVRQAVSGYAGGSQATAHYELVGLGNTGHAESVQVTFDPREISFGKILQIYFSVAHDPTELNRQGPDVGTQYRSEIFFADAEQQRVAQAYIAQLDAAHVFKRPIATKLEPLAGFYPAEAYHQDYATLHPNYPYIVFNDLPKVEALKQTFADLYRDTPALVGAAKTN
jgi:peptide-methionine (S)-S-oxide reductase